LSRSTVEIPPMTKKSPVLVVEDDVWARLIAVVLDPATSVERTAAFADFMSPDEPDFPAWCERARQGAENLNPSEVRLVSSQAQLRAALADADAVVTESLVVGAEELALAPRLRVVHKYGAILRNIDLAACQARGIAVLGVRRRANIACAEHAFALMLTLARRLHRLTGLISTEQLAAVGHPYRPFDRRHVPNGNWGRIPGTRSLHDSTIGIIGLGEIGREIALRAAAFGMKILYFQRTRLPETEETALQVSYRPLDALLAQSDWIVPQLPSDPSTLHLIDRARLAQMKPGACLVNVSRAEVVERAALLDALRSGRLGGFALDPLYEEPGRSDDELLSFENVVLTPHMAGSPRFNGLEDIEDLINGLAREMSK
jgi:phosphoglycerate dehydrogenase-like enzyme